MARRGVQRQRSASPAQRGFVLSLGVLFLIIAGSIGYAFYVQVREWTTNAEGLPEFTTNNPETELNWSPGQPIPTWEGTERVNILVMGIDKRQNEEGPWRTDTMLVVTVDPLTRSAGLLSIPRDLWVPIPGYGEGRINTANYLGDAYDHPGGGPALAMQTVQWNLGLHIHHYVRVDFRAFIEMVDLIGGVDIYVEEEIDDPTYPSSDPADPYGYEPLHIDAGWQHMDGELTLKYARTRHSNGGDFDRARRQQQVLLAVLDKITRLDMLPQLLQRAPQLWTTLSNSIQTDLTLDQIIRLANLATQIPRENIKMAVIDETCTMFWETPDKQQVLIPIRECIRQIRDDIFTSEPTTAEEEDPAARLAAEAATVQVNNGTTTPGLAHQTAEYLQAQGIQVVGYGNADRFDYEESLIVAYNGKTFTAETIARLLNLPPTAVVVQDIPRQGADITIILGADYQLPTP